MRIQRLFGPLAVVCCGLCSLLAGSTGPDDRPLTDPKSVASASNPASRPVPIDDLYYTRSVFGAAWEVYWDGELLGRAGAQGELKIRSKLDAHALRVTLATKKDFEQRVTLVASQATNIQARPGDDGLSAGTVRDNLKDGLKYVWIPPGTFMMGCSPQDKECFDNEKPSHHVSISEGFWLGQAEVRHPPRSGWLDE